MDEIKKRLEKLERDHKKLGAEFASVSKSNETFSGLVKEIKSVLDTMSKQSSKNKYEWLFWGMFASSLIYLLTAYYD